MKLSHQQNKIVISTSVLSTFHYRIFKVNPIIKNSQQIVNYQNIASKTHK